LSGDRPPTIHDAASTIGVDATVQTKAISLNKVAADEGWDVELARRQQSLRGRVAYSIVVVFVLANITTLWIVFGLVQVDQDNIAAHVITPADRIITNQVMMTLLGATAVQVGSIAVIIARYLFPGRQP
jgi:type IV secretory pathway VirB2 component (pilin)